MVIVGNEVLQDVHDAERCPLLHHCVEPALQKPKQRLNYEHRYTLLPVDWLIFVWETVLYDVYKTHTTAFPNHLWVFFQERIDWVLDALDSFYQRGRFVQWVYHLSFETFGNEPKHLHMKHESLRFFGSVCSLRTSIAESSKHYSEHCWVVTVPLYDLKASLYSFSSSVTFINFG